MTTIKAGTRVADRASKCKGTVTLVHRGEFQVQWDNGLAGSFRSLAIFQNSGGVILTDPEFDPEYESTARTF